MKLDYNQINCCSGSQLWIFFTDLDVFGQSAHNGRYAGIEAQSFFDATVEIFHLGHVLRGARTIRLAEDLLQLIGHHLLSSRDQSIRIQSNELLKLALFRRTCCWGCLAMQ